MQHIIHLHHFKLQRNNKTLNSQCDTLLLFYTYTYMYIKALLQDDKMHQFNYK